MSGGVPFKKILSILFLTVLAFFGNYFKYTLFFNVDFLFGGIFVMIIVYRYGWLWGTVSALAASSYTYILWNHPYAISIFTLEALCVGLLLKYSKSKNILLFDALYWLTIGMFQVFLFYHFVMRMNLTSTLLIMLKQSTNGIVNTVIAALVVNYAFYIVDLIRKRKSDALIPFASNLFTVTTAIFVIPLFLVTIFNSRYEMTRVENDVKHKIEIASDSLEETAGSYINRVMANVMSLSNYLQSDPPPDRKRVSAELKALTESEPDIVWMGVTDREGNIDVQYPTFRQDAPSMAHMRGIISAYTAAKHMLIITDSSISSDGAVIPATVMAWPIVAGEEFRGYAFGVMKFDRISIIMNAIVKKWDMDATLTNKQGNVLASTKASVRLLEYFDTPAGVSETRKIDDHLSVRRTAVRNNISVMEGWQTSTYTMEIQFASIPEWILHIEAPVAPYVSELHAIYIRTLAIMLALIYIAILLSTVLSVRIVAPIRKLNAITSDLPDKIAAKSQIQWPQTVTMELEELIRNFKAMSVSLSEHFEELSRTNDFLLKAKERAEELSQAKSMFLANMSHEIRTPLSAISILTDIVLSGTLEADLKEHVTTIKDSAESLMHILNDILDLSKIERNKLRLESIDFDLHATMEQVIKLFSAKTSLKQIAFSYEIESGVPLHLQGDPFRLRQVLMNLVGNAIKFTNEGSISVKVEQVAQADPQRTAEGDIVLRFSVKDTGIGIPKEQQDLIFESFTQADPSITRKYGGTGLGLTISKEIVKLMNGEMQVESEPGKGSTFRFTAVFKPAHNGPAVPVETEEKTQQSGTIRRLRVLVAEDNRINQKAVEHMLDKLGHTAVVAGNGTEALAALRAQQFDIVLMDVQMPGIDGLETTRSIRAGNGSERNARIPIIAMTAHTFKDVIQSCFDAGMNDYLSKPVDIRQLEILLDKYGSG